MQADTADEPAASASGLDAELAELVRRMAGRDESALGRFYDLTIARAHALALRIVRQVEAAEEVVEDAYWQAWRDASRYELERGRALTWLLTICRSRALDYLRRRDPAEATEDIDAAVAQGTDGGIAANADPYVLLDALQRGSAIRAAVETLQPQARQLIALAFFRGLTHQEIADSSGLPLGTVKASLHRACQHLKGVLAGLGLEAHHG